jgi:hypothetical protein
MRDGEPASSHKSSTPRANPLGTDGRNFSGVDSTTHDYWRENYAGEHEGKRHTDKSKDQGVVAALKIGFFAGAVEQRHRPSSFLLDILSQFYARPSCGGMEPP